MGLKRFWLAILIVLSLSVPAYSADIRTGGGHQVYDGISGLQTQRPKLTFTGTIACTDNAGANSTDCAGATATPAPNYYVKGHKWHGKVTSTSNSWLNFTTAQSQYIYLANESAYHNKFEYNTAYSVSAWVRTSLLNGSIVSKWDGSQGVSVKVSGTGTLYVTHRGSAGAGTMTKYATSAIINDNVWHHIAVTKSTSALAVGTKLYIDGIEITSVTVTSDTLGTYSMLNTTPLQIGTMNTGAQLYAGDMEQVAFFDATLSLSTIQTLCGWNGTACVKPFTCGTGGSCATPGPRNNNAIYHLTGSEANLISGFNFNERTGTTAVDIKGANNGTLVNTPVWSGSGFATTDCKLSNCFMFDKSSNSRIEITGKDTNLNGSSALTIEGWVYLGSVADEETYTWISKLNWAATTYSYLVQFSKPGAGNGGKIRFYNSNMDVITSSAEITAKTWTHVAVVFDNSLACGSGKVKIYVNGASKTVTEIACNAGTLPSVIDNTVNIGGTYYNNNSNTQLFNGRIDEFAIWNIALPVSGGTDSIASRYNTGSGASCAGTETGLVYCYHLDETGYGKAANSVTPSGLGSDSNNCTSTTTPCLTVQGVINKIQTASISFIKGSVTVNIASGVYFEGVSIDGLKIVGNNSLTVMGYTNPTPNSFTDVPILSGTSTGSNNDSFPASTGSLFNDATLSQFGTAGSQNRRWLKITSGTFSGNMFPIWKNTSSSALLIAGKFGGVPSTDNYSIYDNQDMATIDGYYYYTSTLDIMKSEGIILKYFRVSRGKSDGIRILHSTLDKDGGTSYDVSNMYIDANSNYESYRGGIETIGSKFGAIIRNIFYDNFEGLNISRHTYSGSTNLNAFVSNRDSGFACEWECVALVVQYNLAESNGDIGFAFEQLSNSTEVDWNRSALNYSGITSSLVSAIVGVGGNIIDSNVIGLFAARTGVILLRNSGGTNSITNNTTGIDCSQNAIVLASTSFTFSGNGTDTNILTGCQYGAY